MELSFKINRLRYTESTKQVIYLVLQKQRAIYLKSKSRSLLEFKETPGIFEKKLCVFLNGAKKENHRIELISAISVHFEYLRWKGPPEDERTF